MLTLRWSLLCALCFGGACSLEPAAAGQTCTRSAQCKAGLACVYPTGDGSATEGRCSADLSSLYDPSQVPMLMTGSGGNAAVDAAAAPDAAAVPDAG